MRLRRSQVIQLRRELYKKEKEEKEKAKRPKTKLAKIVNFFKEYVLTK